MRFPIAPGPGDCVVVFGPLVWETDQEIAAPVLGRTPSCNRPAEAEPKRSRMEARRREAETLCNRCDLDKPHLLMETRQNPHITARFQVVDLEARRKLEKGGRP